MTRDELRATPAITAAQGAAFLGVSRSTWYALDKAGTLPTHRLPPLPGVRMARWCGETLATFGTEADIHARIGMLLRQRRRPRHPRGVAA